jgi:hypothetical protein
MVDTGGAALTCFMYNRISPFAFPMVSVLNTIFKLLGLTKSDLLLLGSQKASGKIYYGLMVHQNYAWLGGMILCASSWYVTIKLYRISKKGISIIWRFLGL